MLNRPNLDIAYTINTEPEIYLEMAEKFRAAFEFIDDAVAAFDPAIIQLFETKFSSSGRDSSSWRDNFQFIDFADNTISDEEGYYKEDLFLDSELQMLSDAGIDVKEGSDVSVMYFFWMQSKGLPIDSPNFFHLDVNQKGFQSYQISLSDEYHVMLIDALLDIENDQPIFSIVEENWSISHEQICVVIPDFDSKVKELMTNLVNSNFRATTYYGLDSLLTGSLFTDEFIDKLAISLDESPTKLHKELVDLSVISEKIWANPQKESPSINEFYRYLNHIRNLDVSSELSLFGAERTDDIVAILDKCRTLYDIKFVPSTHLPSEPSSLKELNASHAFFSLTTRLATVYFEGKDFTTHLDDYCALIEHPLFVEHQEQWPDDLICLLPQIQDYRDSCKLADYLDEVICENETENVIENAMTVDNGFITAPQNTL
ncbi:hypothetical protein GCM10011607_12420 [Shewanella inventionis]|uniref:Uncharacterized protein n=1 Tax=Shewanella inventionis TaxID=1738770 RepID=A0ABQ1IX59_9GAMM|nr:hypothetical protein [Shewanella inventionis]GGB53374.1 hypothetical protein GCM10011607_12420 [Shewanella inventionis]